MFPVLQILLAFALAIMASGWSHWLPLDPVRTPLTTAAFVAFILPLGAIHIALMRRTLRSCQDAPHGWESIARAHYRAVGRFRLVPLALFVAICVVVGWPQYIARSGLAGTILLDEIAQVAPFLVLMVAGWIIQYRLDCVIAGRRRGLRRFVGFQFQQIALPVAPLIVVLTLADVLGTTGLDRKLTTFPFLMEVMVIGVLVAIYVLSGPLMRLFFRGEPLPEGPLRERLEAYATRIGFRYREFLIWHTGLGLINAAIVGGIGRLRYVMFTEGMLATFTDDEVEAVLAHEVGHAKGRHIQLYFIFAITLIFLTRIAREAAVSFLPGDWVHHEYFEFALFAVVVLIYWRLVFGFVSRKFEREADFFGATSIGDHRRFIDTLEEVARKSGTLRTLPSWRHYSIAQRAEFLYRAFEEPALAARFRRAVRFVKIALVLVLLVTMTVAMREVGPQYRAGNLLLQATAAIRDGRFDEARPPVLAAMDDPTVRPHFVRAILFQGSWKGLERLILVDALRLDGRYAGDALREFGRLTDWIARIATSGDLAEARRAVRAIGAYHPAWQGIAGPHAPYDPTLYLPEKLDALRRQIKRAE